MKKTLEAINRLVQDGIISKYAIGGGIAAMFYYEPTTTFDLDVMVLLASEENTLNPLKPIYEWARSHNYTEKDEHIYIEQVPVQFLPAFNELIIEAIENAKRTTFFDIETYIIGAEYLLAIMLHTGRQKDRGRALQFFDEVTLDKDLLNYLLEKYSLKTKFESLISLK